MEAASREVAIRQLADAGHFPIDAVAQSGSTVPASSPSLVDFWRSASAAQIRQFTRQLAMLLGAGLTLPRAMALVEAETGGLAKSALYLADMFEDKLDVATQGWSRFWSP